MQKAVQLHKFGNTDGFSLDDVKIPELIEGYVRVRVKAIAFNPVDYKIRLGLFGGNTPVILGGDFAGVVEAVGANVTHVKVGDEVYGMALGPGSSHGAYAETVTLSQDYVSLKPKALSFTETASSVITGLTAELIFEKLRLQSGNSVLVVGASGGTGQLFIQLAKKAGVKVFATATSSSIQLLQSHFGLESSHIIDYSGLSAEQISEKAIAANGGRGFDATVDLYGGQTMKQVCVESLATSGQFATIVEEEKHKNYVALWPSESDKSLFSKNGTIHTVFVLAAASGKKEEWFWLREHLKKLADDFDNGTLEKPLLEVVGGLSAESVKKAHELLEQHKAHKKLVMTV